MHELHAAHRVLDFALQEAQRQAAKKITSIRVRVSRTSYHDPESLRFCFQIVSRETIAQGAHLEVCLWGPATTCPRCQTAMEPDDADLFCPGCGEPLEQLMPAQDICVDSLEIEC
ncbi:MAG: hydrogenase maturation nickel metallochaperone HypA [Chloroflexi bacterium]|nr:hydrogenase maturation nickel metallochaperone HypA [Chloroflexota bacterium]